jgi:hypothetical protein
MLHCLMPPFPLEQTEESEMSDVLFFFMRQLFIIVNDFVLQQKATGKKFC